MTKVHKYLDLGAVFVATNGVGALGLVCATQAEIQCGVKIEADITTNPILPQTSIAVLGKCKAGKM